MTSTKLAAAVLWDLDGTLVDSEHYWAIGEQILAARYPGEWSHEDGLALTGLSLPVACAVIKEKLEIHDLSVEEISHELTDIVMSKLAENIPWRPGALELVAALQQAGVRQAMVTMSKRRMALAVAEGMNSVLGFEAFEIVVAGDDVVNGKPHPEAYLKAAQLLGLDPSQCVAIEDSVNGLHAAEAAGTRAIGVPNVVTLPPKEGRNIWPTLVGVTPLHLNELF
jgi:HAD superfamily hydrolase (TIGR01509 family)